MINYIDGKFFASPAQALVNTVNTVGVMGKGVAKVFKDIYPDMFKIYQRMCESGELQIGRLQLYKSSNKWILNFPTKKDWRHPSKVEYVEAGLKTFVDSYVEMGINSIAFPALGCGNGGLDFEKQVRPLMEKYLSSLPISIFIYPHKHNYGLPEHTNKAGMKKWLQSEPHLLPFSEVWKDLVNTLENQKRFNTLDKNTPFEAKVEYPDVIKIIATNEVHHIHKEEIMDFWQQLRSYGFISSKDAPSGLNQNFYYLSPIFKVLGYIKVVKLVNENVARNVYGLQYFEPYVYNEKIFTTDEQLNFLYEPRNDY